MTGVPLLNRRRFLAAAMLGSAAVAGVSGCALGEPDQAHAETGNLVKAIDTAETAPATWFADAYEAGYRLYIPSTTNVDHWPRGKSPWEQAAAQFKLALDAGLMIAAYSRDPSLWQMAIQACGPFIDRLQFFALDIEDPKSKLTWEMVDGVRAMGVRPVVYTGEWCWSDVMEGDVTEFSGLPLWDADNVIGWDITSPPDLAVPTPVPFGGWNTPANPRVGVQQGKELDFNGVVVDVGSFSSDFLMPR
jgi:hypothetical protein